jgi:hypothetical protein
MRWLIVLLLLTSTAHADQRFAAFGLGTSIAGNEPGWAVRMEHRFDTGHPEKSDPLFGARLGLDSWDAGGHWGITMPIGSYVGAQVKSMRTTLGGGVGLWTFEKSGGEVHFGISPFASASLEGSMGNLLVSLDGRLSRQVIGEVGDFNVYSVMLMVGKRFTR